jgi:hypothetical protein
MRIPTERDKEIEIGTIRDSKMEASIVNSMRRYFQSDSGKPRQDIESAIMDSMTRYFEGPSHQGFIHIRTSSEEIEDPEAV